MASSSSSFGFDITYRDPKSRARLGVLTTPHGKVETPNFIFCGTKAAVKTLTPQQLKTAKTQIILSNTYHLMLQPGPDLIERMGGLHGFMGWDGPMLTDSGGFQIFSLGHGSVADEIKGRGGRTARKQSILKITEEGAEFRSYLDGRTIFLTPESSIDIQRKLGPDLIVQLDECTPFHVDKAYTERSMLMSMRWGDRSLAQWQRSDDGRQKLYGIIQGGVYPELRKESASYTRDRPFFGTAIGGSLGSDKAQMYEVVSYCIPYIHPDRPVHLLGIGGIEDILQNVRHGIDTFDCVSPTRLARHGWALKKGAVRERINIRNAQFLESRQPIDETCACDTCKHHSMGYIHHLFRARELLGLQLLTVHNVFTMNRLLAEIRQAIAQGTLDILEKEWLNNA